MPVCCMCACQGRLPNTSRHSLSCLRISIFCGQRCSPSPSQRDRTPRTPGCFAPTPGGSFDIVSSDIRADRLGFFADLLRELARDPRVSVTGPSGEIPPDLSWVCADIGGDMMVVVANHSVQEQRISVMAQDRPAQTRVINPEDIGLFRLVRDR